VKQISFYKKSILPAFYAIFLSLLIPEIAIAAADIPTDVGNTVRSLGEIDPGRIEKPVLPRTAGIAQTPTAPEITHPQHGALPEAEAQKITFKLQQIIIGGNTVYAATTLQKLYQDKLNTVVSLVDVENIVQAITTKYRNDGYIISRAILPPQSIKNGIVHIQVLEGFVSAVQVKGDPGYGAPMVKTYGDQVLASKPLTIQTLERYLLLSNDLPGMNARGILTPSKTVPGGADLVLVTEQKHASAFISYDNYGSRYLGPERVSVGADVNSILTAGDATSLRGTTTKDPHELVSLGLSHSLLLGTNGTRLTLGSSVSNTAPGFLLERAEVRGRSEYLFADVAYPIIRSRPKNLLVHGSFNYLNSRTNVANTPLYNDRVRYLKVGATFSALDSWKGVNLVGADFVQGLTGTMGVSNTDTAANRGLLSRPNGRIDFTKLEMNASRLQSLSILSALRPSSALLNEISSQFSVLLAFTGQYAFTPLLSAQQFGIGGSDYGRGYSPSEILGDRGLAGKFELRWNPNSQKAVLKDSQFYAFYDEGAIWNISTAAQQPGKASLASTGAGVRFQFFKHLSGDLFIAQPLTRRVATETQANLNDKRPRGFFQLTLAM
jgi:hemolysin activation/secretion protein